MPGAGFQNGIVFAENVDFSGATIPSNTITTNGQLLIGNTAGVPTHIKVGTLTSPDGSVIIGYSNPNITLSVAGGAHAVDSIAMQTGTSPVVPDVTGLITFNGATVAAGTHPVRTDGTGANTMALEVQISQALAASDATKIGLSNFDSTNFAVDANGFVTFTGGITPASKTEMFDDFIFVDPDSLNGAAATDFYGDFCVKTTGTGWTHTNDTNHPGILTNTSSAATDKGIQSSERVAYTGPQTSFYKFTFEWMAKIDVLSAVNPNYQLAQGMWDNPSAVPEVGPIDGIYFLYNHAVNSGKYQLITRAGGVATTTNTNSTVDTEWHRYKIIVNAAGTSVSFYIDNVEVSGSPVATNIPTTQMLYQYGIHGTAGAASKSFNIDYWYSKFEFTR